MTKIWQALSHLLSGIDHQMYVVNRRSCEKKRLGDRVGWKIFSIVYIAAVIYPSDIMRPLNSMVSCQKGPTLG